MIGRWRFWDVVGGEMGVNVEKYLEGKLGDSLRFYAEVKISKAAHSMIFVSVEYIWLMIFCIRSQVSKQIGV